MNLKTTLLLTVVTLASAAVAAELDALRKAAADEPGSPAVRLKLAAACEKAGDGLAAQRAYWAVYLLAGNDAALRSRARGALLRLDKAWKGVFDLRTKLGSDWRKLGEDLRKAGTPESARLTALWARLPLVVDEQWCSTRDPLADYAKLTIEWRGNKILGKGGMDVLEVPPKQRNDFGGRTIVVEALEITVEGRTYSNQPELEVSAHIGSGKVAWGKAGTAPKAPVWVQARRVGSRDRTMQPIRFWLRYYPTKGLGVATPLGDPRMRGSGKPIKLDKPLTAAVRLESLLPHNKVEVTALTLSLYIRDKHRQ